MQGLRFSRSLGPWGEVFEIPFVRPDDDYLTVFNVFETDTRSDQQRVVDEMRAIVDNADYPGWLSSTVHAGIDEPGTLNRIQWESLADLEARYAGERFTRNTAPLFDRMTSSKRLLRTELEHTQHHPDLGEAIEISPERDDYTVFVILNVDPENQRELLDALAEPDEWIKTVPGYRSHTYYRGIDGTFVVNYAQWESKESYDAFHALPEEQRPSDVRNGRLRARSLITSRWANTYTAVHARSADDS